MNPLLLFPMHFDYVFVGAGLANLSLLHQMSSHTFFKEKTIAIIEPNEKNENDRTWCFWAKSPSGYRSASHEWSSLNFRSAYYHKNQNISPYKYYHIASKDFYQETIQKVSEKLNIKWFRHSLKSIELHQGKTSLSIDNNEIITASLVFNSSLKFSGNLISPECLKQHFFGFKIRAIKKDLPFDTVCLMDFSLNKDDKAVQFGYIIPFNEREALIEYTEFSTKIRDKGEYKEFLLAYLSQMDVSDYEVCETEFGIIPMSDQVFKDRQNDFFINMGSAAGLTKATTGYTFQFIQKDCENVIRSLLNNSTIPMRSSLKRFKFYDRLLLKIIRDEPWQVRNIMEKLFARNKFSRVLRFLDEESSLLSEIRIFVSIPWRPFLKNLFRV